MSGKGPGAQRLAWRWFSGLPMDGRPRTDATWLHRSRNILHYTHSVIWWHHQPRLLRAAIRNAVTWCPLLVAYCLARWRTPTLLALAAVTVALTALAVWRAYLLIRRWNHRRRYVRPLRRALTKELAVPPPRLEIEPDRSKVTIWLPDEFTGGERERLAVRLAVAAKVGMEGPEEEWPLVGKKPRAVFTRSVPPPALVRASAILSPIRAAAEHELILGVGKKDQLICVSIDVETPHVGMSMGTGDGKSATAMNISVQGAWHGWQIIFLDYKLMSHMWARGLSNVAYAGTAEEIHVMLCWLACDDTGESELTRRKQVALASADIRGNVTADLGPRTLIVAEELNTLIKKLKSYWRHIGGKGPSPAIEALEELIFTGRQLRMHLLMIGQRLSAKATSGGGGGDVRENLGTVLMCDPSASTWKMLADGHVQPPASGHKGRYLVVTRREVREMQGALWDEEDARAFATAGTVAVPRADMPFVTRPAGVPLLVAGEQSRYVASDQGIDVQRVALPASRPPGTVTLREAVDAGMWPTIGAARMAKQRYKPSVAGTDGRADLFLIEDLARCRAEEGQR